MQKITDNDLTLMLDSSSVPLLAALVSEGKIYTASKEGIKQEELLFPLLKKLYKKARKDFKDTKNFFFIKGPGRFTGIRIGVTLASVLAEINGTNIASADIFNVLGPAVLESADFTKWHALNPSGKVVIILPAFREEYFVSFTRENSPKWLSVEDLNKELSAQKVPLFLAGWAGAKEGLKKYFGKNYAYSKTNFLTPEILLAAAKKYLGKQTKEEVLTPLYLKPARFELCGK
ncbi:MAG: tRNA (adenosine(37)-N6)-threonylcarbamoyltransferase complex dimerization subunit type 1 TsaB [Elusimicrobiaceae bacterium]|nr:tRNA (adenosine(37)-N6)-threonylcarbamoyltransferase complex dimerization subunit type 1 TsaB [Elusimicrobiaceae bacterium]